MQPLIIILFAIAAFFTHLAVAGFVNPDGWERRVLTWWGTDILWSIDSMKRGWNVVNTPKEQ